MNTVRIAVGYRDNIEHHEISEAAWDLFLSAAEIGIEGAADGANDAHAEDASELEGKLREQIGYPGAPNHPTYDALASADLAEPYASEARDALLNAGAS